MQGPEGERPVADRRARCGGRNAAARTPAGVPVRRSAAAIAAGSLLLAGCGRAVSVTSASPAPTTAITCGTLSERLPPTLAGQARLAVTPDDGTTAAWGNPAIVWRCGVGPPAALRRTSQLLTVDGIDWFPEPLTEGVRFTTVHASPAMELTVPTAYPSPASLLPQLPRGEQATPVR